MTTLLVLLMLSVQEPTVPGYVKVRFAQDAVRTESVQSIARRNGLQLDHALLPYRYSLTAAWSKDAEHNADAFRDRLRALEEPLLRTYVVRVQPETEDALVTCQKLLRGCTGIEVAEPITRAQLCSVVPNDSLVPEQAMLNTIRLPEAWAIERGSDTMRIGISDSGVKQDHEDLTENIAVNANEVPDNGIDDDNNGYVDDHRGYSFTSADDGTKPGDTFNSTEGHGTGVAGICSATTNNGKGVAGVGYRCKIVPLKTMPNGQRGILYGYESMLYCARNGVPVVNCSWGGFTRSCIDESVVAYVLARGTAIVAAAGNHGSTTPFFPAAYPGVLGVGVTDPRDTVVPMSAMGPFVDVMAPGNETKTTSNDGTYGGFCCTSGAAPIVSGIVGLIRSRHPSLTAPQALALARESVDDIRTQNPTYADLLPGRINALKAVTLDPDSTPAIMVVRTRIQNRRNALRYGVGDTLDVVLTIRNELAAIGPMSGTVSVQRDPTGSVALLTPSVLTQALARGEEQDLPPISLVVQRNSDTTVFLRLVCSGTPSKGGNYITQLLTDVTPAPSFVTLANTSMRLSVADHVRIGIADPNRGQGDGVTYRRFCGMLAEGGIMASAGGKVVSSVRGARGTDDHFVPTKPFIEPDPLRGTAEDRAAPDSMRLYCRVDQRVHLASADTALFITDMTFTNIGDSTLQDVALAWFYDWDIGSQPASNRTMFTSATASIPAAIQTVWSTDSVYVSCAVSSSVASATPISAGLDNATTYSGFPPSFKDSVLRSGTSLQYQQPGDIAIVTGMLFPGAWAPNEQRTMRCIIAIDSTSSGALMLAQMGIRTTGIDDSEPSRDALRALDAYPVPATSMVTIPLRTSRSESITIHVRDIQGREIETSRIDIARGDPSVSVDVSRFASGPYIIVVSQGNSRATMPIMVLH